MPFGKHRLQPQGVRDVIGAAQVPSRELQQMGMAHLVFVEAAGLIRIEGPRMGGGEGFGGQGQLPLELSRRERQMGPQLLA